MNYTYQNNPNPSKFLNSYRFLGYDNYSAIADLVDNSFDAGADNVSITVKSVGDKQVISIVDDGIGMDKNTLEQAFRLGALTERDPNKDLGKFGVGSASASLSIARRTIVLSKAMNYPHLVKIVDLDYMIKSNSFNVRLEEVNKEEIVLFKKLCPKSETGTIVILENCDNIQNKNLTQFRNHLRKHLGQVFRMFIDAGKRIQINDETIESVDPLVLSGIKYQDRKYETQVFSDEYYELKFKDNGREIKEKIRIKSVILPLIDKNLVSDAWPHQVDKPSQQNQGFYVMRNNREIAHADHLGLFTKHNDLNRFRSEILFPATLDEHMGVNFTKRKINLNQSVFDQLDEILKEQIETIRKIIKREAATVEDDTKESFRETEKIIENKKKLLIRKKYTEDEIKKEIEQQRQKQETKSPVEAKIAKEKIVDEKGNPKECHFDVTNLGKNGVFFETDKIGHTYVIKYNVDHPFYSRFYSQKDRSTQNDINFLIYSFILATRNFTDEQLAMMGQVEGLWSLNLKALLD